MADHAKLSPSAAHRWMRCPGSLRMSENIPRTSSVYADEGTAAHALLEACLSTGAPVDSFIGQTILVVDDTGWVVSPEMAAAVQVAIDNVARIAAAGDTLWLEERVDFGTAIGLPAGEAFGSADVLAYLPDEKELQVHDYKHGAGEVVSASEDDGSPNPQLALYALGSLAKHPEAKVVRLVIHQPRARGYEGPSEHVMTRDALLAWAETVLHPAVLATTQPDQPLIAGSKQCRWCPAKAACPALREYALEDQFTGSLATPEDFLAAVPVATMPDEAPVVPSTWLAAVMSKADMIEEWLTAVRAEVERRLLAGEEVPGFKLVQGRQGNRAWGDPVAVEKHLKERLRLTKDEMYDLKLISPTTAEKLAKNKGIGPRQWAQLQTMITRSEGKPHVAPVSDPRPALCVTPVASLFDAATINYEEVV